jgi:putative ABC transport system permease protein
MRTAISDVTGTGAVVTDIATVRGTVGSTLTSVDLSGLTRLELAYAVVLAAASASVIGAIVGTVGGAALSGLLVAVLTGVFDPPPAGLVVSWAYLVLVTVVTVGAIAVVTTMSAQAAVRHPISVLRE